MTDVRIDAPQWVLKRKFTVRLPDGSYRVQTLPDARRVKLGGKASLLFTFDGRMVVIWIERVKGGWRLVK